MALTPTLQRATALGTQLALAPWRLFGPLAGPVRRDIADDMRRAIGLRGEPAPPVTDPEAAFLDPDGVARQVHADLGAMLIGGVGALLLQTLHPLVMAGVAEHSRYKEDPTGRLQRTAMFVGVTTFRSKEEARRSIAAVKRVHRRVHGIAPDGRPYSASDPDLVTWVHVTEAYSFLRASQLYGPRRFTQADRDQYFEEMSAVATELGANWAPRSEADAEAYLRRIRPELYAGVQALTARDFLLRGVAQRLEDRAVYAVIVGAAIGLLPGWARRELRLPSPPLLDSLVVTPLATTLCTGLRWVVTAPRGPKAAENQARATRRS